MSESLATQGLPVPTGYRLLIELPKQEKTTEGGIVLPEETTSRERVGSICGKVLAMGPDAYSDERRFPNGPYCEVGQWIMMRSFAGSRFAVNEVEYRLLNDDSVEAVVSGPEGIRKL